MLPGRESVKARDAILVREESQNDNDLDGKPSCAVAVFRTVIAREGLIRPQRKTGEQSGTNRICSNSRARQQRAVLLADRRSSSE